MTNRSPHRPVVQPHKRARNRVRGLLLSVCALLSSVPWSRAADALASSTSSAQLQSLSLEELMSVKVTTQSTVSRVDEKIDEAPGSVYVFSKRLIQERGYRSLGELLQSVPGFTVFHRDLDFVTSVRGLAANDNEKISLLINGQVLNGAIEQDLSLNGPINLDNVERVEVVVGPSSFFQQANTLAATVNIITKDVDGVEAVAAVGNALKYSATLMAGHHWAPDKFLSFSFTTEAKRGFDAWDRDFQSGLAGRKITGELDWPSFFGVLKGQYGEVTAQAIAYRASWPELHINNDPHNDGEMLEQLYTVFLKDEHPWSSALTSIVRLDATYKEQTRRNNNGVPVNAEEQTLKQMVYTGEVGLRYSGFEHQLIQAGVQASYDHNFDQFFTFNTDDSILPLFPNGEHFQKTSFFDKDTFGLGFYIDDTIQVAKWLKLIEGVRMDTNSRLDGDRWFPGARSAVIIEPTPNWITKLIYNRSVRMPSALAALNEVWGINHLDPDPNHIPPQDSAPHFARVSPQAQEPEILSTFELQEIFYLGKARIGASVYHQELSDFTSFFQPHTNGGNFRGNGLELNFQEPIDQRLTVWANASWNDSILHLFNNKAFGAPTGKTEEIHSFVNPEDRIIGSAQYTANVGIAWKMMDHLTLSPSVRYFTEQAGVDFHSQADGGPVFKTIRNRYYLDAALVWDHVFGNDLDVRLSGRNLLDTRDPVASQENGDTYRPRGIEGVLTVDMRF